MTTTRRQDRSRSIASPWTLAEGETTRLLGPRAGPVTIRVERGLLLVTREGDPEDHVLAAGQEASFPVRGKIVAWAFEATSATLRDARASAAEGAPLPPQPGPSAAAA